MCPSWVPGDSCDLAVQALTVLATLSVQVILLTSEPCRRHWAKVIEAAPYLARWALLPGGGRSVPDSAARQELHLAEEEARWRLQELETDAWQELLYRRRIIGRGVAAAEGRAVIQEQELAIQRQIVALDCKAEFWRERLRQAVQQGCEPRTLDHHLCRFDCAARRHCDYPSDNQVEEDKVAGEGMPRVFEHRADGSALALALLELRDRETAGTEGVPPRCATNPVGECDGGTRSPPEPAKLPPSPAGPPPGPAESARMRGSRSAAAHVPFRARGARAAAAAAAPGSPPPPGSPLPCRSAAGGAAL
eukprot:TRINITY_DN21884_c0_g2_i1.p1 TRINITY_DN21884_c0_g2~~TRINITY_DN21884_c0_g2_i1.p1  ORF type:complete len:336 (+),score=60.17 TRINITY_DN21884_c0_g2_i1:93-1010(+)